MEEEYGHSAALVIAAHWRARNEPNEDQLWPRRSVFSRFPEKRAVRKAAPGGTSDEAGTIFEAIERLTGAAATDAEKRRAVALATVATSLLSRAERNQTKGRSKTLPPQPWG